MPTDGIEPEAERMGELERMGERVAETFGLGAPVGPLELVQFSDREAWRLRTAAGDFLVKRLWANEVAEPSGAIGLRAARRAMRLERAAVEAGIDVPPAVVPPRPLVGWAATVEGYGCFRAHRWVEHRRLGDRDDIAEWLGRTVARLHTLQVDSGDERSGPAAYGLVPDQRWRDLADLARRAERPWAGLADRRLGVVLELSGRVRATYSAAPDLVPTHADLEPHNVLVTPSGPVLIDWDTTWVYSAALQAFRVAYAFGHGQPGSMRSILQAYVRGGGDLGWPGDAAMTSTLAHELAALAIRVEVALGLTEPPRWIAAARSDLDAKITDQFDRLPERAAGWTSLARAVAP